MIQYLGCQRSHFDTLRTRIVSIQLSANAHPVVIMRRRLETREGRKLYAKRKCTVEPVIGIVKSVLGFQQFLLRGLQNVKGKLNLVALTLNLKRMFNLKGEMPS